ncbi:Ger(x)C family spore germination protein [Paenibacillus humicola]|uniref:Ger(x)C family spore germination protein n=1 Tax=Paenibacillus humicola TaxID=3110540 RepID=UPI00237A7834|nr:Ger(x)C family spore germination protein [Paenibacillus humicola]
MTAMRILAVVCSCAMTAVLLGGCWSQKNLEQITVVSGIGIDAAPNDRVAVTVQLQNPSPPASAGGGGTAGRRPFAVFSTEGVTVNDALNMLQQQTKKTLFMSQTRAIVIGEPLAKRGLHDPMDYFWRSSNKNLTSWMLISKVPAKEVLSKARELETVPSDAWKLYFMNKNSRPSSGQMKLFQFLPRLDQDGLEATAAGIAPVGQGTMRISETAVFRHDKMAGWLSDDETEMLRWIKKEIGSHVIVLNTKFPGQPAMSFNLTHFRSSVTPQVKGDRISFAIRLKAEAEGTSTPIRLDYTDRAAVDRLETRISGLVREQALAMLNKLCKTYKADAVGFGRKLHRKYPQRWKTLKNGWNDRLPQLEVNVDARVQIVHSGMERISKSEQKD